MKVTVPRDNVDADGKATESDEIPFFIWIIAGVAALLCCCCIILLVVCLIRRNKDDDTSYVGVNVTRADESREYDSAVEPVSQKLADSGSIDSIYQVPNFDKLDTATEYTTISVLFFF